MYVLDFPTPNAAETPVEMRTDQWSLLLTLINFNPGMDKKLHPL